MRHALCMFTACLSLFLHCAPRSMAQETVTTVYVVRHAEKLNPSDPDTPLSPEGQVRAHELAKTLARAGVQRIYATTKLRAQQTVAPLAELRGLELVLLEPGAVDELVQRITTEDVGLVVVVAGHSNTVPNIVKGLSMVDVGGIPEERYDRLFKVVISADGKAKVEELRFGVPTP
ncbi:MAG: histidine phosphatase family protein [Flavobacteriales bacterium]|nr:histidine phosphatase family protein [Flavobacteriales bacterium]